MQNTVERLPKAITKVWQINAGFDLLIAVIIGSIGLVLGIFFQATFWTATGWVIIGLGVLNLIIELLLVPYRWRFWTYRITDRDVELHKGYFFRKEIVVPIARIQNVTISQGPLLRWQKLQAVKLVTAATSHSIDGVTTQTAEQLKDLIMQLAQEANNDL